MEAWKFFFIPSLRQENDVLISLPFHAINCLVTVRPPIVLQYSWKGTKGSARVIKSASTRNGTTVS